MAFSVLAHGAVETWSQSALTIGVASLLLVWGAVCFRKRKLEIHWHPLYIPLLCFAAYVVLQLLAGVSEYPYITRLELLKLALYFSVFFLTTQSMRTREDSIPFVWFVLFLGFSVALFGILQFLSFNGKIYWIRGVRYSGAVFGPYINRNHFAGLMELIIPLGLAVWFLRAVSRDRLLLVVLFTTIPVGALFLSASRAGSITTEVQIGKTAERSHYVIESLMTKRREGRRDSPGLSVFFSICEGPSALCFCWCAFGPT